MEFGADIPTEKEESLQEIGIEEAVRYLIQQFQTMSMILDILAHKVIALEERYGMPDERGIQHPSFISQKAT